ncbi:MAG: TIGR03960 family B12-binding radical SAM protein [Candidatus Brocadiia bacterium]|nr:MAG: TIGR03960 family B12-binding radical SAM protein [Candidatus Brocadiia bacterium]
MYNTSVKTKEIEILTEVLDRRFLPFVRRPSRYIGGEINQISKNLSGCEVTFALCFPDIYEVGMSYNGLAILYDILNNIEGVAAERVFSPWIDAEKVLRENKIPLFSLESKASLKSFDMIGISMTNELCYTNVLNLLDLGGLNVRSNDRDENDPLVIGGGEQCHCCEPMADFFDMFVLGDGEEAIVELTELFRSEKKAGSSKRDILVKAAQEFEWAYVPSLYKYRIEGESKFEPVIAGLRTKFASAVIEDFENSPVPLKPIVPFAEAVHERVSIEIMRGCPGRCRFCKASFCKRPIRFRSVAKIVDIAKQCYLATGFDTVSLLSLSTADYPDLNELTKRLVEYFSDKYVGISVPSLRVDQQLNLLPELVTSVRKSGLTIAVEAAGEKVREIINKPLKDEDLFKAVEAAYVSGWQKVKLYFMVGLPGESEEDIKRIVNLSYDLAILRRKVDGKTGQINAAVSWFVPKAQTPFGWLGQKSKEYFENARKLILDEKRRLRAKFLQFKFHDIGQSILESATGRGDRRLSGIIEAAWSSGARFDLWSECFDYEKWRIAFSKFDMDLETAAQKGFSAEEMVPWEHLGGPEKKYLLGHLEDSLKKMSQQPVLGY